MILIDIQVFKKTGMIGITFDGKYRQGTQKQRTQNKGKEQIKSNEMTVRRCVERATPTSELRLSKLAVA